MLRNFNEYILKTIKDKNLSTDDLSKAIGVSRSGLYKMLDNPTSIKLSVLIDLCNFLDLEINQALGIDNHSIFSDAIIDRSQISLLPKLLIIKKYEESDLALFLNIELKEVPTYLKSSSFGIIELRSICNFFKIPINLFYREQYKSEYKNVKVKDFINHYSLINSSQKIIDYHYEILSIKIILIDTINMIYQRKSVINENKEGFVSVKCNHEYSNFPFHFISKGCNIPIVFLSKYPDQKNSIQPFVEDIVEAVYENHIKFMGIGFSDVIWVELSYFTKESINVSLVKFEQQNKFDEPNWYTIRGVNDNEIKIDIENIKDFLEIK